MIGKTLGHYQITEKLGEGGMGVVFKARDTHLDRFVAIKVLPPEKVADPERKRRFIQEAKAASALNHPSIITIYDIDHADGIDFIAMEYVVGKTLDELIPRKGIRLSLALKYAVQITDALARAHGAGIVHRDLKPSNVMVDEHGLVKVLDFGLAKLTEQIQADESASTETVDAEGRPITEEGVIVGTVAYMSPEQAEGKKVDARSDIFSLGSVLYEMVTGHRAFEGDSRIATLSAILHQEPKAVSGITPAIPADLEKLINRCLRKDPAKRFQHMDDIKVALEELKEESDSGKLAGIAVPERKRTGLWLSGAIAAGTLVVTMGLVWYFRNPDSFLLSWGDGKLPEPNLVNLTSYPGSEGWPSFSPDGSQVAFHWNREKSDNRDIYVKLVAETNALRLTSDPAADAYPAWSPDGTRIAFLRFLKDSESGTVYLVSPLGGSERKLTDFPISGPLSWSPDGKWLAVSRPRASSGSSDDLAGIYLLPLEKGLPRRITSPKVPDFDDYPCFSPDGHWLAYLAFSGEATSDVHVQVLDSDYVPRGEPRRVTQDGLLKYGLAWTRDRKSIIYSCQQSIGLPYLYRVPIEGGGPPRRLELAGVLAFDPCVAAVKDRLAFRRFSADRDVWRYQLGGKPQPFILSSFWDWGPQISPDGRRVAFTSSRNGESAEIWTANADGSNPSQLTDEVGRSQGTPRWSADGRWIAFDSQGENGQFDIFAIDSSGGRPRQITSEPSNEHHPSWSRDGRWIYFRSDRTGQNEIWRIPAGGGPAQQITTSGGNVVFESIDGSTLFYSKETGGLFARPLAGGSERKLVDYVSLGFAVTRDGIYYFGPPSEDRKRPLLFYEFPSGTSRSLARIEGVWREEITVSPDGKTFLYNAYLIEGSDLMLIENFR